MMYNWVTKLCVINNYYFIIIIILKIKELLLYSQILLIKTVFVIDL